MKTLDEIERLLRIARQQWIDEVAQLETDNTKLQEKIEKLEDDMVLFDYHAERCHEAICAGNRDEAIRLLNLICHEEFRSVAEQRNLFPDRVPA